MDGTECHLACLPLFFPFYVCDVISRPFQHPCRLHQGILFCLFALRFFFVATAKPGVPQNTWVSGLFFFSSSLFFFYFFIMDAASIVALFFRSRELSSLSTPLSSAVLSPCPSIPRLFILLLSCSALWLRSPKVRSRMFWKQNSDFLCPTSLVLIAVARKMLHKGEIRGMDT